MKRHLLILAAASLLSALSLAGAVPFLQDDQDDEDPVPQALRSLSAKELAELIAKKRQEAMAKGVRYISVRNRTNRPLVVRPYWIVDKEKVFGSTTLRVASKDDGRIDLSDLKPRPPAKQRIYVEMRIVVSPTLELKPSIFKGTFVGPIFFDPESKRSTPLWASGNYSANDRSHTQNVPIINNNPPSSGGG